MRSREQALGGRAAAGRTERWSVSEVGKHRGGSLPPQHSMACLFVPSHQSQPPRKVTLSKKTLLSRYSRKMHIFISLPSCCVYLVKALAHWLWVGFILRG